MTLYLDPLDVLLFRDGRPRVLGDSHLMSGTFPPPPSALYGGFRSAILAHQSAAFSRHDKEEDPAPVRETFSRLSPEVKKVVGEWNSRTGELALGLVTLAQVENGKAHRLYPLGQDLVLPKDRSNVGNALPLHLLQPVERAGYVSSLPNGFAPLGVPGVNDFLEPVGGFVTQEAFVAYLMGNMQNAALAAHAKSLKVDDKPESYYGVEERVSVSLMHQTVDGKRPRTGTGSDGMLFTSRMTRLNTNTGLLVEVNDHGMLPKNGVMRLGAEMRAVAWSKKDMDVFPSESIVDALRDKSQLRLVVVSPAPFENGWVPDFLNPNTLKGELGGIAVELKGASVGRYVSIGGWDMATNKPRNAQRAVPIGSVYYLSCENGKAAEVAKHVMGTSLFASHTESAKLGLGIVYPGTW